MAAKTKYISGPPAPELDPTVSLAEVLFEGFKRNNVNSISQIEAETGREMTFGELARQTFSMVQGLLREGVGEGSVVSIICHNSLEAHVVMLACILIGATPATIDSSLVTVEMADLLNQVDPIVVYTESGETLKTVEAALTLLKTKPLLVVPEENKHPYKSFQSLLLPADPDFRPSITKSIEEHVALIIFTSGTTGLPKGVMISDALVLFSIQAIPYPKSGLTFLRTNAIFWLGGAIITMNNVISEFKMIFYYDPPKEDDILEIIEKYKVTLWLSPPTLLQSLLVLPNRDAYDISTLKVVQSVGVALTADSQIRIQREVFKDKAIVLQAYGMTELGGVANSMPGKNKLGSSGLLIHGASVKIEDMETGESLGPGEEGEVCLKVKYFMLGYVKNPEATRETLDEDGWFHTGDIGYYDEDGFLFIMDRMKDLIKYKLYHISPAQIENVLMKHPAVKDCSVFGIPHPIDGDHATAFIVAHKNVTENELLEYVAERVSENKQLRGGIRFVEFIPRTLTGKPKRRELRAQLMAELQGINSMKVSMKHLEASASKKQ